MLIRRRLPRYHCLLGALLVAALLSTASYAAADGVTETRGGARAKANGKNTKPPKMGTGGSSSGGGASKNANVPKNEYQKRWNRYRDEAAKNTARNDESAREFEECINGPGTTVCNQTVSAYVDPPGGGQAGGAPDARPALPPRTLAYMAVADLRLAAPTPSIGPAPDRNRWKMAAVGYPLWLAADGDLNPATVSDSVLDVSVSLDPRLVKVVFDMGDGERVTCTDLSRRWTPAVEPGAESPTCGHTYTEPSLPKGDYTVTATSVWAIDWTVNGATGTLPFNNSATAQLPVGELQVLVR